MEFATARAWYTFCVRMLCPFVRAPTVAKLLKVSVTMLGECRRRLLSA
jgi:hypothetical protein